MSRQFATSGGWMLWREQALGGCGRPSPEMVSGPGHRISHQAQGPRIFMPFDSELGRAIIEICFE